MQCFKKIAENLETLGNTGKQLEAFDGHVNFLLSYTNQGGEACAHLGKRQISNSAV